jgi:uncharacterized flavoprotein (TIGR03862 family)
MVADVLSSRGIPVSLYEKRKSAGRKLLVAGSSGLNITNDLPVREFAQHFSSSSLASKTFFFDLISEFDPKQWIRFIEELGVSTFLGTSGRYFIEDKKAARFVNTWTDKLKKQGVEFHYGEELVDFSSVGVSVTLRFDSGLTKTFGAAFLGLGGGSWEPSEKPLRWPSIFTRNKIGFREFAASNVGYQVKWKEAFLKEAEGLPLKTISLSTARGTKKGELTVTRYGIEGTPVYFVGCKGKATLDLKPDLGVDAILTKLRSAKENLSPIRRVKKQLGLCPASFALLFHETDPDTLKNPDLMMIARKIKALPIHLSESQPLVEAISSSGGVKMSELGENLMLKRFPRIFLGGEMLDWDVPTGGFLIQGSVSQGKRAAEGIIAALG